MFRKKVSIFLAVLVLLVLILGAVFFKTRNAEENSTPTGPENTGAYTVTYYSDDGTILKLDSAAENGASVPPAEPKMTYGSIFKSWDADLTCITGDLEVYPVCESFAGQSNVFVAAGAYGKAGDTVAVPILLCGDVCVSGFDLTVTYDPEQVELVSLDEDGAVVYNDEVPGQLRINYVSIENTVSDVDVVRMMFRINSGSTGSDITINVNGIYACEAGMESNNDNMHIPEYCVSGSKIHVIP